MSPNDRMALTDLKFLYFIVKNMLDCPELLSRVGLQTNAARVRLPRLLHHPYAHNNYARNSVLSRCIDTRDDLMNESDVFFLSLGQFI